jgi:hypothetical protein
MAFGQGRVLCGLGYPGPPLGDKPGGLGECVEPGDAVAQKVSAPVMERMQSETLIRSLLIRMTRSASLLSKGTRRS